VRRSDQRRAAVIALYQHDLTKQPLDETLGREPRALTRPIGRSSWTR
jgi:hypothetical protein